MGILKKKKKKTNGVHGYRCLRPQQSYNLIGQELGKFDFNNDMALEGCELAVACYSDRWGQTGKKPGDDVKAQCRKGTEGAKITAKQVKAWCNKQFGKK